MVISGRVGWLPRSSGSLMAERALGREPRLCGLGGGEVPVEDFGAVPVQHTLETARIIVDRFEVFDAVRLAADIGMDRQRHDLGAALSLGVEAIELIDRALGEVLALAVLNGQDG